MISAMQNKNVSFKAGGVFEIKPKHFTPQTVDNFFTNPDRRISAIFTPDTYIPDYLSENRRPTNAERDSNGKPIPVYIEAKDDPQVDKVKVALDALGVTNYRFHQNAMLLHMEDPTKPGWKRLTFESNPCDLPRNLLVESVQEVENLYKNPY